MWLPVHRVSQDHTENIMCECLMKSALRTHGCHIKIAEIIVKLALPGLTVGASQIKASLSKGVFVVAAFRECPNVTSVGQSY